MNAPHQQGQQMPPSQQTSEKDHGNVTLFRTANFFVHAVMKKTTGMLRTGDLRKAGGGDTILERIRWTSIERQRLIAAQTRLLPQADPIDSAQWREISISLWPEMFVVVLILAIPLTMQALNMFNYPAYTPDEGNLISNAWAILHGQSQPYAYDHSPIGWLQIALWLQLTSSIAGFGNAINNGRVLMLVLAGASSLLVYLITSRISGSRSAALLAMLIYTLSPLSLLYRHEILLDNIGIFWLLLTLGLITAGKSKLSTFVLAAVTMGITILTQEILLLFLPVVLYAVWLYVTEFQRKFLLLTFLYITLAIVSVYVLFALLQGQLFPPGVLPGDNQPHPSLIGGLLHEWQIPVVRFSESWHTWIQADWPLLLIGTIAMFINILGGTVNRFQLLAALLAASFSIFLLTSSVVYPFSIVPLLPFLAFNIAIALNAPLRWVTMRIGFDLVRAALYFLLIGALIPASIQRADPLLTKNMAEPQRQAMLWTRNNVPPNAVIITNSYMFTDLRDQNGMGVGGGTPFTHAYIYSSAVLDPQVFAVQLKGDWQKIGFLVVDPTMLTEIRANEHYALLNQALHHGILRWQSGSSDDGTLIQIYQVIST